MQTPLETEPANLGGEVNVTPPFTAGGRDRMRGGMRRPDRDTDGLNEY